MNVFDAMYNSGWRYNYRTNSFYKEAMSVTFFQAEQALRDAENGIDRAAPANDDDGA